MRVKRHFVSRAGWYLIAGVLFAAMLAGLFATPYIIEAMVRHG